MHDFLAKSDSPGGFIVVIIFMVIWAISWVISKANKASEEARRTQVRRQIGNDPRYGNARRPPSGPPSMDLLAAAAQANRRNLPRVNTGLTPPPQRRMGTPKAKAKSPPRRSPSGPPALPPPFLQQMMPQVPAMPPLEPMPQAASPRTKSAAAARSASAPQASASAALLGKWLNPQTLRAQFMLTEILQPPVALREHHLE